MNIPYKWGALAGLAAIILFVISFSGDFYLSPESKYVSLITYPVLGLFILLGLQETKKKNGGLLSFGRSMYFGLLISGLAGVIMSLFSWAFFEYVKPEVKDKVAELAETAFVKEIDSNLVNLDDYKKSLQLSFDSVLMTSEDKLKVPQAIQDSVSKINTKIESVKSQYSPGAQLVGFTGSFVLLGMVFSVLIAAFMVNKKSL